MHHEPRDCLPVGLCAQVACIWEATARKPGNVHPHAHFADTRYEDFLLSSAAIAPVIEAASSRSVGLTVLDCVRATRGVTRCNTNLGILLLLAPLAVVPSHVRLSTGIGAVLDSLTIDDSTAVFQAIRLANPGGLGRAPDQDVHDEPTETLKAIMSMAADRDLVARQYANRFYEVLKVGVPALEAGLSHTRNLEQAIIFCHLTLMREYADTLIARKRGHAEAIEAAARAKRVLDLNWPHSEVALRGFRDLDDWLRAEGNSRNPGTTADLVSASLFAALREGSITLPLNFPWTVEAGNA